MKTLFAGICLLLTTFTSLGAVPDYKAFRGIGGVTVTTNPPPLGDGTIVIDGSGISAGALPTYALTNNQSTAITLNGTVTNAGDVRLTGGGVYVASGAGSGLYVAGQTRTATATVTNALTMQNVIHSRPAVFNSSGQLTNDLVQVNSWRAWADPVTSGQYYAQNKGLDINLSSNDFSGLLQYIFNRGVDGTFLRIEPSPYYTNNYTLTNTVIITNAFIMEGNGNSTTVLRLATNSAGPMFQLGTIGNPLGGIGRIRKLRFEGDPGTAAGVGVKVVNCAEPVFSDSEWTGFKLAGIQISETNYNHWALAERCWFVGKDSTAHGILFDNEGNAPSQNHFTINECIFGSFGGMVHGVTVSNYYPNLVIQNNHFRYSSGTLNAGIGLLAGSRYLIQGNQFVNYSGSQYPILFYDRGSATNYSSSVVNNYASRSGGNGPTYCVVLGDFVQGIFLNGNHSENGTPVGYTGNNGVVNDFNSLGLTLDPTSTNFIFSLTEDASPASGDFIVTMDVSTAQLKKVQRANFDSGGSGATNGLAVIAVNRVESDTIINTNAITAASVVVNQYLHAAVITNHTAEPLAVGLGVLRIEGSNQFYFINVLSNITINSGTSVLLRSNVTYGIWVSNTTFTVGTEATWQWKDGATLSDAPSFQNGAYLIRLRRDFMGTNAWLETGRQFSAVAGFNVTFGTNTTSGLVTNNIKQGLTNIVGIAYELGILNVATNTAQTNLTINFSPDATNHLDVYSTNWWTQWTNVSGLSATGVRHKTIRFTPSAPGQGVTNVWPSSGLNHGLYTWKTNVNSPMWQVFTNGKTYVVSLTAMGTNLHPTVTLWE
jgi:hypothetical protein